MEKTLNDLIEEEGRKHTVTTQDRRIKEDDRRQEKTVPRQRLVLMHDENATLRIPSVPITSPEQCAEIFRQIFKGARQEIAAVISLSKQLEFLNAAPVAWGGIDHVLVEPRNLFTEVLCRTNAAYFILAHNHPSGDPTPSIDDMKLLRQVWRDSWYFDCRMKDFMIIGDGTDKYYSHRNVSFYLDTMPPPCHCEI